MPNFCPNCGANLPNPEVKFCNDCGASLQTAPPVTRDSPELIHAEEKNPWVATLCSFFIPGLGQVYNGETAKGIGIFFGTLVGFFLFFIPGLLVWLFGLYDAYTTAKKMNSGEIPFKPTRTAHLILFIVLAVFTTLVIVFLIFLLFAATVLSTMAHPVIQSLPTPAPLNAPL